MPFRARPSKGGMEGVGMSRQGQPQWRGQAMGSCTSSGVGGAMASLLLVAFAMPSSTWAAKRYVSGSEVVSSPV